MSEALAMTQAGVDLNTPSQFTLSAVAADQALRPMADFREWWQDRHANGRFEVAPITFDELDNWYFDATTGNLRHQSGRFFTVEGLRVRDGMTDASFQPILNQPEIGILGILAKEFDGVLHFLMQAKMEPGNINMLQLSPTVQATRSNYTRVHHGANTRYLEYFRQLDHAEVLVDVLQSEQGSWFYHKRNRNIIVKVAEDVPEHEDFHWLTLRQLRELLGSESIVSMDGRTVLSCMPFVRPGRWFRPNRDDQFTEALLRSYDAGHNGVPALHNQHEILSWFTEAKSECEQSAQLMPLAEIKGWSRRDEEIADDLAREFRITAVRVAAGNREVTEWSQPMVAPRGQGLAAFIARPINGVLHLLVRALPQPGIRDMVEMAPTVQLAPTDDPSDWPITGGPFTQDVLTTDSARVRYDTVQSEEGGRFFHALTRYRVIEVGEDFPIRVPKNFCWMTVRQLMELIRHDHYLNIEARSLLTCVHSLW